MPTLRQLLVTQCAYPERMYLGHLQAMIHNIGTESSTAGYPHTATFVGWVSEAYRTSVIRD